MPVGFVQKIELLLDYSNPVIYESDLFNTIEELQEYSNTHWIEIMNIAKSINHKFQARTSIFFFRNDIEDRQLIGYDHSYSRLIYSKDQPIEKREEFVKYVRIRSTFYKVPEKY